MVLNARGLIAISSSMCHHLQDDGLHKTISIFLCPFKLAVTSEKVNAAGNYENVALSPGEVLQIFFCVVPGVVDEQPILKSFAVPSPSNGHTNFSETLQVIWSVGIR